MQRLKFLPNFGGFMLFDAGLDGQNVVGGAKYSEHLKKILQPDYVLTVSNPARVVQVVQEINNVVVTPIPKTTQAVSANPEPTTTATTTTTTVTTTTVETTTQSVHEKEVDKEIGNHTLKEEPTHQSFFTQRPTEEFTELATTEAVTTKITTTATTSTTTTKVPSLKIIKSQKLTQNPEKSKY